MCLFATAKDTKGSYCCKRDKNATLHSIPARMAHSPAGVSLGLWQPARSRMASTVLGTSVSDVTPSSTTKSAAETTQSYFQWQNGDPTSLLCPDHHLKKVKFSGMRESLGFPKPLHPQQWSAFNFTESLNAIFLLFDGPSRLYTFVCRWQRFELPTVQIISGLKVKGLGKTEMDRMNKGLQTFQSICQMAFFLQWEPGSGDLCWEMLSASAWPWCL